MATNAVAPLIFMDTETTGISLKDDIWEFAAIRRDPDGAESELHLFIKHSPKKCHRLPRSFLVDHAKRYDPEAAVSPGEAAGKIWEFTRQHDGEERPHIVGAVPNFDTERITKLLHGFGYEPEWHYHLIDVENLAIGYLAGRYEGFVPRMVVGVVDPTEAELRAGMTPGRLMHLAGEPMRTGSILTPPWHSDDLSRALGIEIDEEARHTAMGDVRWVRATYDRIMGGAA